MSAIMKVRGWAWSAAIVLGIVVGCQSGPDRPDKSPPLPPRPSAEASNAAAPSSSSAPPSDAPTTSQGPGATAVAPGGAFTGAWQGAYDAKKGSVELPPKVKDKTRAADDGKAVAGAGKVELTISAEGEVRGKASGALGDATLTGKVDEGAGMLRASWFPDDNTAPNAMTGVLIGILKDAVIAAEIRVAGPDATLVRESKIELKRK